MNWVCIEKCPVLENTRNGIGIVVIRWVPKSIPSFYVNTWMIVHNSWSTARKICSIKVKRQLSLALLCDQANKIIISTHVQCRRLHRNLNRTPSQKNLHAMNHVWVTHLGKALVHRPGVHLMHQHIVLFYRLLVLSGCILAFHNGIGTHLYHILKEFLRCSLSQVCGLFAGIQGRDICILPCHSAPNVTVDLVFCTRLPSMGRLQVLSIINFHVKIALLMTHSFWAYLSTFDNKP